MHTLETHNSKPYFTRDNSNIEHGTEKYFIYNSKIVSFF